ncbi:hypothetical protein [Pontibacter arcticus]|uniref:Uncharacterized protein n=1 Tax=Pontibacter arcticus TaxID=2080288 RepID=A0A364RCD4_9BACT|nr:hypothetical protein [Pontibacter arcticus]RAU81952.1 hypothetical protein DP923_14825 [Pontibacter arcticus]
MSKQTTYTPITHEAFSQYLNSHISLEELIEKLRYIEQLLVADDEEETDKSVWFRFFAGDTLKTTISDIEKELATPNHPNYNILRQGIAFGLQTEELEIHYA